MNNSCAIAISTRLVSPERVNGLDNDVRDMARVPVLPTWQKKEGSAEPEVYASSSSSGLNPPYRALHDCDKLGRARALEELGAVL
jgi:hypothetical protein